MPRVEELDWISKVSRFLIDWLTGFFAKTGLSRPREAWWSGCEGGWLKLAQGESFCQCSQSSVSQGPNTGPRMMRFRDEQCASRGRSWSSERRLWVSLGYSSHWLQGWWLDGHTDFIPCSFISYYSVTTTYSLSGALQACVSRVWYFLPQVRVESTKALFRPWTRILTSCVSSAVLRQYL